MPTTSSIESRGTLRVPLRSETLTASTRPHGVVGVGVVAAAAGTADAPPFSAATKWPDLPPSFSRRRVDSTTMSRWWALSMS